MKKNSRTKNTILNFITSTGGQLLATALKFVTRTIFIQVLGKSYLGINGLFSDILTMLSLTELGFDSAINFKLYKPLAQNDIKRVRILMKFFRQVYAVVGCTILAMGLMVIPLLPHLIRDYDTLALLGLNAVGIFLLHLMNSVCSYLFFAYRTAVIRADQKVYILSIADFFVVLLSNLVQIIILLTTGSFVLYTATLVLFSVLQNLVNAVIIKRRYPEVFIPEPESLSRQEVADMFKDCGALFVYKVEGVVLKATDNMVLSSFIGLTIVGMYSNYLILYNTITSFLKKLYGATKASVGNLYVVADMKTKYVFFQVMNYLTAVLYGTACVGIAVEANELLRCWIGVDYLIPQPFPVLVGIEIFFVGIKENLGQVRQISGVFRQMWFRPILGVIVNLGVSITLVRKYGIYGVLMGTVAADVLTHFLVDPFVIYRHTFEEYRPVAEYYKKNVGYCLLLLVIGMLDAWLCSVVMVGYGWASFVVHVCICGLSVPAAFALVYWNSAERNYLFRKLRSIVKLRTAAGKR